MAVRKEKIAPQEYAAGEGWEIGNVAPEDAYRALDGAGGGLLTGPVVHTHPGGHARLIVSKGQPITEGVVRELAAAEADTDESGEG
jgi:hypothetical protein